MFHALFSAVGMVAGVATLVMGFRNEARMRGIGERLRAGALTESEAARGYVGLLSRFRVFAVVIASVVAGLLAAVLVHAVVVDDWGGRTVYNAVVLAVVLMVSAAWLRRLRDRIAAARAMVQRSS